MDIYIPTKEEFEQTVESAVRRVLSQEITPAVREAQKSETLDTRQLENEFGISQRRQQYLRDSGQIPYHKTGRKILYKRVDIDRYLSERRIAADTQ